MEQIFELFNYLVDAGYEIYQTEIENMHPITLRVLEKYSTKKEVVILFLKNIKNQEEPFTLEEKKDLQGNFYLDLSLNNLHTICFKYLPGEYIEQLTPKMSISFEDLSSKTIFRKQGYCASYLGSLVSLEGIFHKYTVEEHYQAITLEKQLEL